MVIYIFFQNPFSFSFQKLENRNILSLFYKNLKNTIYPLQFKTLSKMVLFYKKILILIIVINL
jgi:hypothetical protein